VEESNCVFDVMIKVITLIVQKQTPEPKEPMPVESKLEQLRALDSQSSEAEENNEYKDFFQLFYN